MGLLRLPRAHRVPSLPAAGSAIPGMHREAPNVGSGGNTMTSTPPTVPAVPDLVFTDPERLALAGFPAGYRGLTRDAYALDPPVPLLVRAPRPRALLGPSNGHRAVGPGARGSRPRPCDCRPAALHGRRVLPLRRGGGPGGHLAGGPCPLLKASTWATRSCASGLEKSTSKVSSCQTEIRYCGILGAPFDSGWVSGSAGVSCEAREGGQQEDSARARSSRATVTTRVFRDQVS